MPFRLFILVLLIGAFGCRKQEVPAEDSASSASYARLSIPQWGSGSGSDSGQDQPARPDPRTNRESFEVYWDQSTFTDDFRRVVEGHLDMELFGDHVHLAESVDYPQVVDHGSSLPGNAYFTRIVRSDLPAAMMRYGQSLPNRSVPLRGYWAPVFEEVRNTMPVKLSQDDLPEGPRQIGELIDHQLAREGLLATLLSAIQLLGFDRCLEDPDAAVRDLRDLGFPVDWLSCFAAPRRDLQFPRRAMVQSLAEQLKAGADPAQLRAEAMTLPFEFSPSRPGYRAASETGRDAIGLVRMQMGGGYHDGIVPGGSIDLVAQMVKRLPEADFLVHVPENVVDNVKWLARRYWPLSRTNHLTVLAEPLPVSPWAQDNGKAGVEESSAELPARRHLTLIPRYASQEEAPTRFMPGESFLMRTLVESGHAVAQSPLLFQGGNLLAVVQPRTKKRLLLVGEAEVHRNQAMGLTSDQVLQAFRLEFGVDQCVRMPAASFHIDYDMTIREHQGRLLAFVNDTMAAVRLILERGIEALGANGVLNAAQTESARHDLAGEHYRELYQTLGPVVYAQAGPDGVYAPEFQSLFAAAPVDSSSHNMRCFLVALDLVASRVLTEKEWKALPEFYRDYLTSLRLLESQAQRQQELLVKLGCAIVPVPSLADVPAGLNYLNGLQDKSRYLMPVQGGFYQALDAAATRAFEQTLGPSVEIVPIVSGECQRAHGAVHCAAAAYPKLDGARDDS